MTWLEFNTAVRVHLVSHNRRQGIQTLIDALIKAAVLDLQSSIPAMRNGHVTTYPTIRFTTEGFAGRARFPVGAVVRGAFTRDPADSTKRFDIPRAESFEVEQSMLDGSIPYGTRRISIDSTRGIFRVSPNPVEDLTAVSLVWDGLKSDYEDDDDVNFAQKTDLVVADFVLARLSRQIDGDMASAQSYAATYAQGKRTLKSDWSETVTGKQS